MKLTLSDFNAAVDPTILRRGIEYWRNGAVDVPEELDEDCWVVYVQGTEAYEVRVTLNHGDVTRYLCTCPYDLGPVCKHVVAALYALQERLPEYAPAESESPPPKPRKPTTKRKRETVAHRIDRALDALSLDQTRTLLRRIALESREARVLLLAEVAQDGGMATKADYIEIVRESVRAAKGSYGVIDYGGTRLAVKGADAILSQAAAYLSEGRHEQAIPIYQAVIEQLTPTLMNADDSEGYLMGTVSDAFKGFSECAAALDEPSLREELYRYCLTESRKEVYADFGWHRTFLTLCGTLVNTDEEEAELFDTLDGTSKSDQNGGFVSQHSAERTLEIKLEVTRRRHGEQAADALMRENLNLPSVREEAIQRAFDKGRFGEVKRLALDALKETKDPRQLLYARTWEIWLLRVAQEESDTDSIRQYARKLFQGSSDFYYYDALKTTYSAAEWSKQVEYLLRDLKKNHWYPAQTVAEIHIREEQWERLFAQLAQRPSYESIEAYRKHLEPRFPEKMIDLYADAVDEMLKDTSGRPTYRNACQLLRRMRALGAGDRVGQMIEWLRKAYGNRRALLEELNAV
ncbi:MAG: SWIM zinc finger family protein [Candidatus Poribacteria bacterium]|nr:SWIM zinc finger family protein [Candidatus Poribacteria bacterium]